VKASGLVIASAFILAMTVATATEPSHPAVWSPHLMIVDVGKLPKRYTCDELWYKFRDVLLAVGARPDMKILPYGCESRLGLRAYAPKVQLEFSVPREVSGRAALSADMQAVTKSIRLEPGAPSHIDDQDCDLLRLMKSTLLSYIGVSVADFHLACGAPPSSKPPFGLTVRTLVPVPESPSHVASARSSDGGRLARSGS
jgi:hypothetical protein